MRVFLKPLLIDRSDNATDRVVKALEHRVADVVFVCVTRRLIKRPMYCVEGHIKKEPFVAGLLGDDPFGLGSKQIGRIAFFPDRLLVAVPIVNRKTGRRVVDNGLGVIVDASALLVCYEGA